MLKVQNGQPVEFDAKWILSTIAKAFREESNAKETIKWEMQTREMQVKTFIRLNKFEADEEM